MRISIAAAILALGATASVVAAQSPGPGGGNDPLNATCPVSGRAVDPGADTVSFDGKTIGFCCNRCDSRFESWDDERKAAFVTASMAERSGGVESEIYALATCPVSGERLGGMGDPVVKTYDGREVRFCCEKCIGRFESKQAEYFEKIDEQMVRDQLAYYPMTTCVISGEPLVEDGEDIAKNVIYANRLVRFCCNMCKGDFMDDPEAGLAKLDKAVKRAQGDAYPLDTCLVSGEELGSMGDPVEIVVANRLVRFCCDMCVPKFEADPAPYLEKLDAAWKAQGMPGKVKNDDGVEVGG